MQLAIASCPPAPAGIQSTILVGGLSVRGCCVAQSVVGPETVDLVTSNCVVVDSSQSSVVLRVEI